MKGKLYIYALLVLAAMTGCRKQPVPDAIPVLPEETKEMVISVKSDAPDPKFTFLFWHKEDFDKGLKSENGNILQPYHVSGPTGDIGDYEEPDASTGPSESRENDYNTGRIYPENYGIAVCTGYGPYDGVTPVKRTDLPVKTTDYSVLNVTEPGVTDVVVSQNYLEGSSIYPFRGNLEFFHPQIKLTVDAKLAETMAKYIRNVSFTVDRVNLLKSLKWSTGQSPTYLPSQDHPVEDRTCTLSNENINSSEPKLIGTVYVVPDEGLTMESMDLTISGEIGNASQGPYTRFDMTVPVAFKDDDGNDLTLKLNDSYKILLLFDEDQIEITAVKVPWQEGGNVLVPIHPLPET